MPVDNWNDPGFTKDPLQTALNNIDAGQKKPKTPHRPVAITPLATTPESDGFRDDEFTDLSVAESACQPCSRSIDMERLVGLPPEQFATDADATHLNTCGYHRGLYQHTKRAEEPW